LGEGRVRVSVLEVALTSILSQRERRQEAGTWATSDHGEEHPFSAPVKMRPVV
jgi:hypothetical protein